MNGNKGPALKVEHLTVNYDKTPVLWDIHFEVPEGKLVAIIGPNGAGKSTLIKAALGITEPLSGKVQFWGQPLKNVRRRIAYVPQRSSVDWDFPITVEEVVLMGCYGRLGFFKWPRAADRETARLALEKVGMTEFAKRQISELSGGQQQRLFLARALVENADIFFLDEPFAGIDIATEKTIISLLHQLKMEGKTLFIVHHDLNTVDKDFDWVVMLNTCLIGSGPTEEVLTHDNIVRAYGKSGLLLDEVARLSKEKRI